MKEFFADFLELLVSSALIICLAFASFLLISNMYHHQEISYEYGINLSDTSYAEYKKALANVDKKMKSVDISNIKYDTTAKPIYAYYESCIKSLNEGTFSALETKTSVNAKDIYDSNNEILTTYNKTCIFNVPYNITVVNKNFKPKVSFDKVYKQTEQKREIIVTNAEYLTKSELGNSSYNFSTNTSKFTIYNKVSNELTLTINNYKLVSSILDDVANWYVLEFGGNN